MKAADLPKSTRALLRTPEAKAAFPRLRAQGWLVPLIECSNPVFKRLGAQLLIQEVACAVSPAREAKHRLEVLPRRKPGRGPGWRSPNGRAVCRYCARSISVKNDGALRAHETESSGGSPCSGSGTRPDGSLPIRDEGKGDAAATLREIRAARVAPPEPFFPPPWVEVEEAPDTVRDASPPWAEDFARAELEERREAERAARIEEREARENARAERLERAARLGIFARR